MKSLFIVGKMDGFTRDWLHKNLTISVVNFFSYGLKCDKIN